MTRALYDSRQVVGIVTLQDAMKVAKEKRNKVSVVEIAAKCLIVVFPETPVAEAFEKMIRHNIGRPLLWMKRINVRY